MVCVRKNTGEDVGQGLDRLAQGTTALPMEAFMNVTTPVPLTENLGH